MKSETLSDIESVPTDSERPNCKKISTSRENNTSRRKTTNTAVCREQSPLANTANDNVGNSSSDPKKVPPGTPGFGSRLSPTTRRKSFRNSKKWRKVQQSESNSLENEKNVALNYLSQNNAASGSQHQPKSTTTMASLFVRPVEKPDDSNDLTVESCWNQRSASARQKKRSSASPNSSNLSSGRNSIWNSQSDKLMSLAPPPMQYNRGGGSFRRGSSIRGRRKDYGSDPNSRYSSRQNSTTQCSFDHNSFEDPETGRGRATVFEKWTSDLKKAFVRGKPTIDSTTANSQISQDSSSSMKAFQRYILKATSLSGKFT